MANRAMPLLSCWSTTDFALLLMIILQLISSGWQGFTSPLFTSSAKDTEDDYATISDEAYNVERAYGISSKPSTNEEQYAEASGPRYLELKPAVVGEQYAEASDPKYLEMGQRNMDGTYVNVSKKPADMDGTYVNISKKPADDTYANVLKKPSGYQ
ncbi:uncharacterized protein LOC106880794 [Octopus bimaculoides]|uniref:uncharacterized protein LOC106880794 n=1 Tax=Octopus bimaculoides TaxID=37653 RepID=UPI0022E46081|nr:uncharacterized protein LOC106880794 [Octopus bimaculoides]